MKNGRTAGLIEAPLEDVEMGNDEDQEPLEAEVPRARMNPKNPTSREKQEREDTACSISFLAVFIKDQGFRI